jgi:uncharacterized repeat protein (TIGR01451 family)
MVKNGSILVTLFTLFSVLHVDSDTHYVSTTGGNIYPYTSWETAADSVMKAMGVAGKGDTVHVAAGTYFEHVVMKEGISLVGAGRDSCVIDIHESRERDVIIAADSTLITGFHIVGKEEIDDRSKGISDTQSFVTYQRIENNTISDCYIGIAASNESDTTVVQEIIGNEFMHNRYSVNIDNAGLTIVRGNYFHRNEHALHCQFGTFHILNNEIRRMFYHAIYWNKGSDGVMKNNFVIDNGWYETIRMKDFSGSLIVQNNTIADNLGTCLIVDADMILIKNNIITGNSMAGTLNSKYVILSYNNMWGNWNGNGIEADSMEGNMSANPMFVGDGDYHLQFASLCIDRGDPAVPDVDGSRSDLGAYGGPGGENYEYVDLPPSKPEISSYAFDGTSVVLNWEENTESDLSHYDIFRDTLSGFIPENENRIGSIASPPFFDPGVRIGSAYYYRVSAWDYSGLESEFSNVVMVNISPEWWLDLWCNPDPQSLIPPGSTIKYSIYYHNVGDAAATSTVLVDTLDSCVEYLYNIDDGLYNPDNRTVTWSLGTIESDDGFYTRIYVRIPLEIPYGTRILNTAAITCAEGVSKEKSMTITVKPIPDLTINVTTLVRAAYSGKEMVYNIDYGNVGDGVATDVLLTDFLPGQTTFVSCTHDGKLDASGERVIWRLGNLRPIEPSLLPDVLCTVRVDTTFSSTEILVNRACLTWAGEPDSSFCSETTDTISAPPELSCSVKSRDSFVRAGDEMLYRIQYGNCGKSAAHSIVITDSISDHTKYVACSGGGEYDPSSGQVTWYAEKLESREETIVTLTLLAGSPLPARTLIINKASVSCAEGFSSSSAETTVVLSAPAWDLMMTANHQEIVRNRPVTFTTRLRNNGNMDAENTIVFNPIPDNTTYSSNTGGGTYEAAENTLTWHLGPVPVNEERTISLTVTVSPIFPTDTALINRAYIQSELSADSVSLFLPLLHPQCYTLLQNHPNPFNQMTRITYQLPEDVFVRLSVYNVLGQKVMNLVHEKKQAGTHSVPWEGRDELDQSLPSGIYLCKMSVNGGRWTDTKKMVLMR